MLLAESQAAAATYVRRWIPTAAENPVKSSIVSTAEDYHYSSAPFYKYGVDEFNIVTHYAG
jgi:hypothetical protein